MNRDFELQGDGCEVSSVLRFHLLAENRQAFFGNGCLAVGGINLRAAGVGLTLGMPGIVNIDGCQYNHQQHIGHGGICHYLVDAKSEYPFCHGDIARWNGRNSHSSRFSYFLSWLLS